MKIPVHSFGSSRIHPHLIDRLLKRQQALFKQCEVFLMFLREQFLNLMPMRPEGTIIGLVHLARGAVLFLRVNHPAFIRITKFIGDRPAAMPESTPGRIAHLPSEDSCGTSATAALLYFPAIFQPHRLPLSKNAKQRHIQICRTCVTVMSPPRYCVARRTKTFHPQN